MGGKACNLALLANNGFKTAQFFVIPNTLHRRVLSRGLSLDIQKEIMSNLLLMNGNKFAVRSSANYEDGNGSSFAGQFESYLSLSRSQVIDAIYNCYQVAMSGQVKLYCNYHGIDPAGIKMAIIVQEMVNADKGGVVFTKNLESQCGKEMVIEAATGLGEQVVSGLVDPQKIIINKKTKNIVQVINNGNSVLNKDELSNLTGTSLKIEKLFGQPQDIEWAIAGKELFILQTRPITT